LARLPVDFYVPRTTASIILLRPAALGWRAVECWSGFCCCFVRSKPRTARELLRWTITCRSVLESRNWRLSGAVLYRSGVPDSRLAWIRGRRFPSTLFWAGGQRRAGAASPPAVHQPGVLDECLCCGLAGQNGSHRRTRLPLTSSDLSCQLRRIVRYCRWAWPQKLIQNGLLYAWCGLVVIVPVAVVLPVNVQRPLPVWSSPG